MADIELLPLEVSDRKQFILDNQESFNYGALVEFGLRDNHFEEPDEIISRETIKCSAILFIDVKKGCRSWQPFSIQGFIQM